MRSPAPPAARRGTDTTSSFRHRSTMHASARPVSPCNLCSNSVHSTRSPNPPNVRVAVWHAAPDISEPARRCRERSLLLRRSTRCRRRGHRSEARMHTRLRVRLGTIALLAAAWTGAALRVHSTPQNATTTAARAWIEQTAAIEECLKTAAIVRFEDIGTGVTRPRRAYLTPGSLVESLTWKPLTPGRRGGYWESYKSEIAAYALDKRLALHMVPPTVEREVDGALGAAVMWVTPTTSVKQMGGTLPAGRVPGHDVRRMQTFDNFIGNPDRNAGNILVDAANNVILIDHSRAFVENTALPFKIERVDEELWTAIEALTLDDLGALLGPLIGDRAVNAMIERRGRMKKAIDALVAKKGRALVIVPTSAG